MNHSRRYISHYLFTLSALLISGYQISPILGADNVKAPATSMPTGQPVATDPVKGNTNPLGSKTADEPSIETINTAFATDSSKAAVKLSNDWLKPLITAKRYAEITALSPRGILAAPSDTNVVENLQKARVQSLLALGKPAEALSQAKSLYNIASMKGTAEAILLMAQCLSISPDHDKAALDRFKAQQLVGANVDIGTPTTNLGSPVFKSIKVDGKPYEDAIQKLTGEDYASLVGRGNLLLLADLPTEARECFERAYMICKGDNKESLAAATENLARAMKAEDGTVGRANAWVLSLRPESPAPKTSTPEASGNFATSEPATTKPNKPVSKPKSKPATSRPVDAPATMPEAP